MGYMFPLSALSLILLVRGFCAGGGNLGPVMHALPHEMPDHRRRGHMGSLIIGNSGADLKALVNGLAKVFKGRSIRNKLSRLHLARIDPMKMMRTEAVASNRIEDPKNSALFQQYPKLLKDDTLIHLICDTLRLVVVSSGTLDPHAVEDVMDAALKNHHHHAIKPADGLQNLADALPALGIVAAVLGVVKTMGSIDKPPEVLGGMIGSALVGTFLGVLLAYGFVGPFATRARTVIESDGAIYHTVKQLIIASLHGHPQPLVIEAARSGVEHSNQPSFAEVFDGMRGR